MMSLLIFESIHYVMIAEEILKKGNIDYTLVSIPKALAPECGMALEINCEIIKKVLKILKNNELPPVKVYENYKSILYMNKKRNMYDNKN